MKTFDRAMARQADAEQEKRAKIIAAEGESLAAAALRKASDIMMVHPLGLQLRNLQTLIEIGVDKNTTVVFPGPLMGTMGPAWGGQDPPCVKPKVAQVRPYPGVTLVAQNPACSPAHSSLTASKQPIAR